MIHENRTNFDSLRVIRIAVKIRFDAKSVLLISFLIELLFIIIIIVFIIIIIIIIIITIIILIILIISIIIIIIIIINIYSGHIYKYNGSSPYKL